jgi:hypothetical protein
MLAFDEPNKRMRFAATHRNSDGTRYPVWVRFYVAHCKEPVIKSLLYDGSGPNAHRLNFTTIAFKTRTVELERSVFSTIIKDAQQLWTAEFGEPTPNTGSSRKLRQCPSQEESEDEEYGQSETGSKRKRQSTPTTQQASESNAKTSVLFGYEVDGSNVYEDDARLPHDRNLASNRSDRPIPEQAEPIDRSLSSSKRRQRVPKLLSPCREGTSPTSPTAHTTANDGPEKDDLVQPEPNGSERPRSTTTNVSNPQVPGILQAVHRNDTEDQNKNYIPDLGLRARRRQAFREEFRLFRKRLEERFEKEFPDESLLD